MDTGDAKIAFIDPLSQLWHADESNCVVSASLIRSSVKGKKILLSVDRNWFIIKKLHVSVSVYMQSVRHLIAIIREKIFVDGRHSKAKCYDGFCPNLWHWWLRWFEMTRKDGTSRKCLPLMCFKGFPRVQINKDIIFRKISIETSQCIRCSMNHFVSFPSIFLSPFTIFQAQGWMLCLNCTVMNLNLTDQFFPLEITSNSLDL